MLSMSFLPLFRYRVDSYVSGSSLKGLRKGMIQYYRRINRELAWVIEKVEKNKEVAKIIANNTVDEQFEIQSIVHISPTIGESEPFTEREVKGGQLCTN